MNDNNRVREVVDLILDDYKRGRDIDKTEVFSQPDQDAVRLITQKLLRVLYPGYYRDKVYKSYNLDSNLNVLIEDIIYNLTKQIGFVLQYQNENERKDQSYTPDRAGVRAGHVGTKADGVSADESRAREGEEETLHVKYLSDRRCSAGGKCEVDMSEEAVTARARNIAIRFFQQIPKIREYLDTDLEATLEGDPAALNKDEIILSYPGVLAITINRLAHELYMLNVPLIPRMMTEYAHSLTGIDIHPGATIGKYFFIDHGTGIVIGSTTVIGEHVKVYQGVTLVALSTSGGQSLRGVKRHPTIEDNVTIYSGASILGGDTVIGANSVIGGNCFITRSIPTGTTVTIKNQELSYRNENGEKITGEVEQDETWFYVI